LDGIVAKDLQKDILIEAGAKSGTQKVTFKSTSAKITKDAAIASLGKQKDTYVVKELTIAGGKKEEGKE
jgi:hypothetical protein